MTQIARVACSHDCPDSCLMDVTIDNGRGVKITANKEHRFMLPPARWLHSGDGGISCLAAKATSIM